MDMLSFLEEAKSDAEPFDANEQARTAGGVLE
jgi:hypothetical protein